MQTYDSPVSAFGVKTLVRVVSETSEAWGTQTRQELTSIPWTLWEHVAAHCRRDRPLTIAMLEIPLDYPVWKKEEWTPCQCEYARSIGRRCRLVVRFRDDPGWPPICACCRGSSWENPWCGCRCYDCTDVVWAAHCKAGKRDHNCEYLDKLRAARPDSDTTLSTKAAASVAPPPGLSAPSSVGGAEAYSDGPEASSSGSPEVSSLLRPSFCTTRPPLQLIQRVLLKDPGVHLKEPPGPFKGPRGPFKGPRDPLKGPRGPAESTCA